MQLSDFINSYKILDQCTEIKLLAICSGRKLKSQHEHRLTVNSFSALLNLGNIREPKNQIIIPTRCSGNEMGEFFFSQSFIKVFNVCSGTSFFYLIFYFCLNCIFHINIIFHKMLFEKVQNEILIKIVIKLYQTQK